MDEDYDEGFENGRASRDEEVANLKQELCEVRTERDALRAAVEAHERFLDFVRDNNLIYFPNNDNIKISKE